MNIPDLINGAFETTGGFVCFLNIRRLLKDRSIQGVDWRVSAFFSAWGFWNLFYYPHLGQWLSFLGGVGLVLTNTTWVVLALRLRSYERWIANQPIPSLKTEQFRRHIFGHKAFHPGCPYCERALTDLPEIKHTYKCECDLCVDPDRGNIS